MTEKVNSKKTRRFVFVFLIVASVLLAFSGCDSGKDISKTTLATKQGDNFGDFSSLMGTTGKSSAVQTNAPTKSSDSQTDPASKASDGSISSVTRTSDISGKNNTTNSSKATGATGATETTGTGKYFFTGESRYPPTDDDRDGDGYRDKVY